MILKKAFLLLAFLLSLPVFVTAGVLTWWASDREEPVHVNRVKVLPRNAKPCSTVQLEVDRTGYRTTGVRIERFFVSSSQQREPLPDMEYDVNPGPLGNYKYRLPFTLPCTFSAGWAFYEGATTYHRNPLQKYVWPIDGGRRREWFCVFTDEVAPQQACKPDAHLPPTD